MFRMVRLRISAALKRSFRVLVIFPLIITGLAFTCAAVCLSFLTVLSLALGHHDAESRLASAQLLPRSDLWNGTTADLMSAPDEPQQGVQFISFESRFSSAQPLLRSDFRNGATASLASVPNALPQGFQFIRLDAPTLAPMAFTQFCLKYPDDCKSGRLSFEGDRIELNDMRRSELENVNRTVNSSIHPERNLDGLAGEKWLLSPVRGDCNDYAVTKRHQLITRGWPARDVLLSEVATVSGEHHLVTVVLVSHALSMGAHSDAQKSKLLGIGFRTERLRHAPNRRPDART
jgi:predicted transglutaminase-like cysteine proteinase